jgi:hypothetical protein
MKFAPLAAIVAMALTTSACVIIDADDHQDVSVSMTKSDLEPIFGATIDKDALVVRVSSNGCTRLDDFAVETQRRDGVATFTFTRKRPGPVPRPGRRGRRHALLSRRLRRGSRRQDPRAQPAGAALGLRWASVGLSLVSTGEPDGAATGGTVRGGKPMAAINMTPHRARACWRCFAVVAGHALIVRA